MKYQGNFFSLPNDIFILGLCPGELSVYSYLRRCEDQKTHQCWPSYKNIGSATGMSENTVSKYVQKLVDRGMIATEPTKVTTRNGMTRNGNLLYTVLPPLDVIDQHYQQKLVELGQETERIRVQKLQEQQAPGALWTPL